MDAVNLQACLSWSNGTTGTSIFPAVDGQVKFCGIPLGVSSSWSLRDLLAVEVVNEKDCGAASCQHERTLESRAHVSMARKPTCTYNTDDVKQSEECKRCRGDRLHCTEGR